MAKDFEKGQYTAPEGSPVVEYAATFVCSVLMFCVGCHTGFNSPALVILTAPDSPITLTGSDASTIASSLSVGHMIAPTITLFLVDTLGRKKSLLLVGLPSVISWGLIAVADNVLVLCIGRFFGGLSFGLGITVIPIYLAEIVSARLRGSLGVLGGTSLNGGIFIICVMLSYWSIPVSAWMMMGIAIASIVGTSFLPESPYFLAMTGKFEEAEEALEILRGKTDVSEELSIVKETVRIQGNEVKVLTGDGEKLAVEEDGSRRNAFTALKSLFRVKGNRRALLINSVLIIIMSWGGYGAFMVYGSVIFKDMKTEVGGRVAITMISIIQLVFNILTSFLIEKVGRRSLSLVSGVATGVCTLIIGIYFYLVEYMNVDVSGYSNIAVFLSFLFIALVNIGLMPVQLVVLAETVAPEVKSWISLILGVGGGLTSTIGMKIYLMMAVTWGFGHCVPFFGFTIINIMCTAVLLKYLPETKGMTFLQIQKELNA